MSKLFRLAVASVAIPADEHAPSVIDGAIAAIAEAGERGADLILHARRNRYHRRRNLRPIHPGRTPGVFPYPRAGRPIAHRRGGVALRQSRRGAMPIRVFSSAAPGELLGIYRKVHPAPTEEAILTDPADGDPFPVFDFEGIRLGIAICMDIHFPEMFRIYGLKGADLVCVTHHVSRLHRRHA